MPEKTDKRYAPLYSVSEVARYLKLPETTLRYWVKGRGRAKPVITAPAKNPYRLLSFINLVEAHVLFSITRGRKMNLREVRNALDYIAQTMAVDSSHPLAQLKLFTDGRSVIVDHFGNLVNATRRGQYEMEKIIEVYLDRVVFDDQELPLDLYPFSHKVTNKKIALHEQLRDQPRLVRINPNISFGRPILVGTGIPTIIIFNRFESGETLTGLAEDYGRNVDEIGAAILYETTKRAA